MVAEPKYLDLASGLGRAIPNAPNAALLMAAAAAPVGSPPPPPLLDLVSTRPWPDENGGADMGLTREDVDDMPSLTLPSGESSLWVLSLSFLGTFLIVMKLCGGW